MNLMNCMGFFIFEAVSIEWYDLLHSASKDLKKLKESIVRTYPQLKKSRDELEFGYKLAFPGLSEEKGKMNLVEPKERKGLLDNIKGMFGN